MKRAKTAPPLPFAATEPSVHKWRSAGGRVASARFAAASRAEKVADESDGVGAMSSRSGQKWTLEQSVHGGGPWTKGSVVTVSTCTLICCLGCSMPAAPGMLSLPLHLGSCTLCHLAPYSGSFGLSSGLHVRCMLSVSESPFPESCWFCCCCCFCYCWAYYLSTVFCSTCALQFSVQHVHLLSLRSNIAAAASNNGMACHSGQSSSFSKMVASDNVFYGLFIWAH